VATYHRVWRGEACRPLPFPLVSIRLLPTAWMLVAALLLAGCGSSSSSSSATRAASSTSATSTPATAAQLGPEGVLLEQGPVLAPASTTTPGTTVDGVQCAPIEQLAYHIHAHLQVYVNGAPRELPAAIGLIGPVAQQTPEGPFYGAERCYYWLHTHANDGIIHIESPTPRVYTLGDFFDEWGQPLSADRVASAPGKVTASLNGKPWTKSPRSIPLKAHAVIQLDVGTPLVRPQAVSFGSEGL
jgi:hypothetical protein